MTNCLYFKEEGTEVESGNVSWLGGNYQYTPGIHQVDISHQVIQKINNNSLIPEQKISFDQAVNDVWTEIHKK